MTSTPTSAPRFRVGDRIVSKRYRNHYTIKLDYGERFLLHDTCGYAIVYPKRMMNANFDKE